MRIGRGKNICLGHCSLNMHIGTYVSSQKQPEMQGRCTRAIRTHARALSRKALQERHAQDFEALTWTSFWPQRE